MLTEAAKGTKLSLITNKESTISSMVTEEEADKVNKFFFNNVCFL